MFFRKTLYSARIRPLFALVMVASSVSIFYFLFSIFFPLPPFLPFPSSRVEWRHWGCFAHIVLQAPDNTSIDFLSSSFDSFIHMNILSLLCTHSLDSSCFQGWSTRVFFSVCWLCVYVCSVSPAISLSRPSWWYEGNAGKNLWWSCCCALSGFVVLIFDLLTDRELHISIFLYQVSTKTHLNCCLFLSPTFFFLKLLNVHPYSSSNLFVLVQDILLCSFSHWYPYFVMFVQYIFSSPPLAGIFGSKRVADVFPSRGQISQSSWSCYDRISTRTTWIWSRRWNPLQKWRSFRKTGAILE